MARSHLGIEKVLSLSLRQSAFRSLIALQVAAVTLLLAASLVMLLRIGRTAVDREATREATERGLVRADDLLARRGASGLLIVPDWPDTLAPEDWDLLDRWLSLQSRAALELLKDGEAGFYVASGDRYLGYASTADPSPSSSKKTTRRHSSEPPPRVFDLIDGQAREALLRDRPLLARIQAPPDRLLLRTAPVWVNGRKVAATWTLTRITEPEPADRAIRRYQFAIGLALAGLVLAVLLSLSLAFTIRRQATERERLRVELRRSERLAALGKLLAGVAHEVRNPLAGIRSTAQLWQRGLPQAPDDVCGMIAEVDRLESIVSRLLQFSRADGLRMSPGDVNALVAEAAQLVRLPAEGQGVAIELNLATDLPPVEMSSASALQMLRNLTSNALQVMPEGGVLRLSTRRSAGGRAVEIAVSDTGPGLLPEARDHLFEPFFTTKADGTGIGLAIAREIALAHRADLTIADGGPGATFVVTFPAPRRRLRGLAFSEGGALR